MDKKLIRSQNRLKLVYMRDFVLSYMKWEANPEKSFTSIFREELKATGLYKSSLDMRKLIKEIEVYLETSLFMQAFVCFKELIKDGNFDKSLKKGGYDFKKIKTQIDVDGVEKTTNSQQLISIIREAIAHNDDNLISNWFVEDNKICITSKKDKMGNRHNIKISLTNMVQLMLLYLANIDWSHYDTNEIKVSVNKLKRAIKEQTLTKAQVGNIFNAMRQKSGKQEMDDYQKNAMFNCLTKTDFFLYDDGKHIDEDFLAMLYPFKENAFFNCGDAMDIATILNNLHNSYTNYNKFTNTAAENYILSFGKEKFPMRAQHWILFMVGKSGKIPSVLVNNLLFNMFTFESETILKKCFREDLDIRRIRNSLMHGRHFFNYNSAYEFYDGRKEMEHIGTITCAEIMNATNILVDTYIKERDSKKEI